MSLFACLFPSYSVMLSNFSFVRRMSICLLEEISVLLCFLFWGERFGSYPEVLMDDFCGPR